VISVLGCLAAVAFMAPAAHGAASTCTATTVVAAADADAWIDANSVTANKGSDAVLSVGDTSRTLVRFRLPSGAPEGCVVESARLRMFADSGTEGTRVVALPLASGWSESSVTWETQPEASETGAAAWSRDGYVQWNVTAQLPAMLAGPNHGFVLRDAAEGTELAGGHGFYAREKGDNPPQLVIRFAPPPTGEPAPPAPPVPAAVECGQLVTQSTLVTNDLSDCLGDGLLIGAPRIIVDLGGHTIDGVKLGTGVRNEGYESVTIRNGTVTEFDHGVELLEETRRNRVEGLHLHHNEVAAIELFDAGGVADGNEIRGNTVEDNGGGILLLSGTKGTVVAGNTMTLNSGAAMLLRDSDANRLEGNRVVGGGDLGVGLEHSSGNVLIGNVVSDTSDGGIEIGAGSHDNRVEGSDVRQSGDTGILVDESDGNELIGNLTLGMSDSGITLNAANDGVVRDNQLGGNPGGLQMDGSSRNLVEANDASDGSGIGVELGGGSFGNTLQFNTANGNGAQGIYVSDEALLEPGNVLHRNTANENGADGITVAKGGHTITANLALGNKGWGINAIGINFVSMNVAAGNGQAGQCLGIVCVPPDVTPPETTIDSGPGASTNRANATFTFSSNEEFATFECSLEGAPFARCDSPAAYADLADGGHELRVRATDVSGNVDASPASYAWSIDHAPPATTIESSPDALTRSTTARFAFSAGESGSTFECSLDGAAFTSCSSPAEYAGLAEGSHTFEVRATDAAGNTDATPERRKWTIDNTAPETTIASGPGALTSSTGATFTFLAGEEGATFECSLDGAALAACDSPAAYAGLGEGSHTFEVRATDKVGNGDLTAASYAWTIDRTAPDTTIEAGPDALTNSTTATLRFSAGESATFECSLDDAAFSACSSPAGYTDLAAGRHELRVRATDAAGNREDPPASYAWTIDRTAPQTAIDGGPDAFTNSTTARLTFSADEPSTFECSLDGAAFSACDSPAAYADLTEGSHTFEVRATDAAGNTDATPPRHDWTIDLTAPQTTIDSGPDALTSSTGATLAFSANEGAAFECSLDDAAFSACDSPASYADLAEGSHTVEVRATDAAGNTDAMPARHAWTIDRTAPQTTIDSGPDAITNSTAARVTFSADEPSTFECSLDNAPFSPCDSPASYVDLAAGDHELRVRATDRAGNADDTPARHAWTIDRTAPQTTVDSGPDGITDDATARLTFSADEASTFECSLDDAPFSPCESPQRYSDLAGGSHTFEVRATDKAGNADDTPARHAWTIDLTSPEATVDSGPDAITDDATARLTFSADEASTFECSLDDAAFSPCESPQRYSDLAEGSHTFEVRATDQAGNADDTPATHAWTIDLTAPQTTLVALTDDTSARFTFTADEASTFECSLDNAAFTACSAPIDYADLAAGDHTFEVRATDKAGNADGTPARHAWTIREPGDTTAPETTIDTAPAPSTESTTAAFAFSADEASTFDCSLDDAPFSPCESPQRYGDLAVGPHSFEVRATDGAGNRDETAARHAWTILEPSDTTAPETSIDTGPDALTTSTTARFTFSADEPATFECSLDDAAFTSCGSPRDYAGLATGDHEFRVRATDAAGNVDDTPARHAWTIRPPADTTAPQTAVDSGPDAITSSTSARVSFSADEPATFECSLDGAAFAACASPRDYANLAAGGHELRVRATDVAGNVDATPARHAWTIDRTAPQTTIDSGPDALTTSTTARFTFSANEAGSTFECSLDGATFSRCASPQEFVNVAEGEHQLRVRAIDEAGNVDATPAARVWTIDRTAPQTTISTATTTGTSAHFTFVAGEPGSTFACSLDGAAFATCASPRDYANLAPGSHEFRVRATDAAGNGDATPASHSWTIQPPPEGCVPATITAAASADSWVLESSATSNYRNDSALKVDSKARGNARVLVRFALPAIPAGCRVTGATLRMYASSYKANRKLAAQRLAAPWTESGITWSNQPATTGVETTTPSGFGYREWQVASHVESMYTDGNHGFLIRDTLEGDNGIEQAFNSREKGSDNPPQLVITFG
jgi:parallel beta-helix repeat protein